MSSSPDSRASTPEQPVTSLAPDRHSTDVAPSIADGDRAAAVGDWTRAIGNWQALLEGCDRDAAAKRINWFLSEADAVNSGTVGFQRPRHNLRLFLVGTLFGSVLATAMVLVAEGVSGATATMLAAVAWLLYGVSAILAVVYAYRTGQPFRGAPGRLAPDDIARARRLAERIGTTADREAPAMRR